MKALRNKALSLADRHAVSRWRDFAAAGVTPSTIARLVEDGELERIGRGLYRRAQQDVSEHQSLIEAAKTAPLGVICLLSALRFHGLTTQLPHAVWLMIDQKARAPKSVSQRLKIIRASGASLTAGVTRRRLEGVTIAITTPAKTVADCFKYRGRTGIDVAIEALRDGLNQRAFTPDEFLKMATINRVARVVRPYLEALL